MIGRTGQAKHGWQNMTGAERAVQNRTGRPGQEEYFLLRYLLIYALSQTFQDKTANLTIKVMKMDGQKGMFSDRGVINKENHEQGQ